MAEGTGFARVMLGGSASVFMLFVISAALRGAGDAAVAMRVLWFANALNIVLGPLFIFGPGPFPELGVTGAAVATTIGRSAGVVYAAYHLLKGAGHIAVHREAPQGQRAGHGSPRPPVCGGNVPDPHQHGGMDRAHPHHRHLRQHRRRRIRDCDAHRDLRPPAGVRPEQRGATMVGQSLGAGNPDRAERSVWTASRYNLAFLGALGVVFVTLAPWIVAAFTAEPEVARVATRPSNHRAGFSAVCLRDGHVPVIQRSGRHWTPTWINLFVFWLFEIPLTYVLANRRCRIEADSWP